MATESIGSLIPTAIPGYADAADIQAALRAYHYGSYSYNPANTSPASLVNPSMAKTIYDIQSDITTLQNRPSSGGDVATTAPVPGDFTPSGIPNGYIWVDQDGTIGGQPTSATAVFTATAPTSSLSTGVIWVDQDPASIFNNPFIATSLISAKGDIIVGTADDTASVLNVATTNGFVLNVNSATTSGLAWVDSAASTQTFTNKSISLGSNTLTGTTAQFNTALTDGDFATLAGTETLTGKTISGTSNTITNIAITSAVSGLGTNVAAFLATPSSLNLASAITDETGSGALVFATSPSLTTPNLGTPSAVTLTNATGLPVTSGISGMGAGVATFLATPSSANLLAAVTDETGTGSLVFGTSPTITTPIITLNTSTPSFTTNAYTLVSGDQYRFLLASNGATAGTVNIPTNASVAFPLGTQITIVQTGAGQLTIAATTPATTTVLSNGATTAQPKLRTQYSSATLIKTGTDTWYVVGDIN